MNRSLLAALAIALLLPLGSGAARAEFGAADSVPGATLLLPYFEVDLGDVNGGDTVFTVFNSGNRPNVAHVTLWTDWGVPTFAFDLVLYPRGAQEVFLREVFLGRIPEAPAEFLLAAASLQGVGFSNCSDPLLDEGDVAHITAAHTGQGSARYGNRCAGADRGDGVARGFVTIDVLSNCAGGTLPTDSGYFGDSGIASTANVLSGFHALVDRGAGYAAGEMLVPIEANPILSGSSFYSTFAGSGGEDSRERLSSVWGGAFIGGGDTRATDVVVWRDPLQEISPVGCGGTPEGVPLTPADVELSDEDGNTISLGGFAPFPLATNRVRVGSDALPSLYDNGYARIAFAVGGPIVAATSGIFVPFDAQSYVVFIHHHGIGPASAHRASDLRVFE